MLRDVSPILFLTDKEGWPVIAARVPDGCVNVGDRLRPLLGLCTEDEQFVGGWTGGTRLVSTALGIGFLSMRWRFCIGIGLFLRLELPERELLCAVREDLLLGNFQTSPDLLAKVEAEPGHLPHDRVLHTAETAQRAVTRLHHLAEGMPRPDVYGRVPVDSVLSWLHGIAGDVGCIVEPLTVQRRAYWGEMLDLPPAEFCRWYPEPLWEAFLVTMLLLARRYAPTRMAACTLSVGAELDNYTADVELRFDAFVRNTHTAVPKSLRRRHSRAPEELPLPPEQPLCLPPEIAAGLNQLQLAADIYDAVFRWSAGEPVPFEAEDAVLFPVRAHLVYLSNPHREREGDIKVPIDFVYDI